MLRHNGEIHQIMICEILHIMSMVHRAVMHLSLSNLFYDIIIMESSSAAYHLIIPFYSYLIDLQLITNT